MQQQQQQQQSQHQKLLRECQRLQSEYHEVGLRIFEEKRHLEVLKTQGQTLGNQHRQVIASQLDPNFVKSFCEKETEWGDHQTILNSEAYRSAQKKLGQMEQEVSEKRREVLAAKAQMQDNL